MEPQTSTSLLTNLLETLVTHVTNQVITVMEPRLVAMQQQLDAPRKDVLEFNKTLTAWMDDNFIDSKIDIAVGNAMDNLDLTDAISEAVSNHDFAEAISDGIENADFSEKISEGVKDLSFSVTVN